MADRLRHAHILTTVKVYENALMQSRREANSKIVQLVLGQKTGELDEEISDEMYAGHTSRLFLPCERKAESS